MGIRQKIRDNKARRQAEYELWEAERYAAAEAARPPLLPPDSYREKQLYFVRHGRYIRDELTEEGEEQARAAAELFVSYGIGHTAVILTSTETRAIQTANIIQDLVGIDRLFYSVLLTPQNAREFERQSAHELVNEELEIYGQEWGEDVVIAVTHSPVVSIASGSFFDDDQIIEKGEVKKFDPWELKGVA